MLAYYSSLIKKEQVGNRISRDALEVAEEANDLICDLKTLSVVASDRNIEDSLALIEKLDENVKVVSAMILNLKNNLQGYAESLVVKQVTQEEVKQPVTSNNVASANDQITGLIDAVKALKEMQNSANQ